MASSLVWQKRILERLPDAPDDVWIEIGAGRGQLPVKSAATARGCVAPTALGIFFGSLPRAYAAGLRLCRPFGAKRDALRIREGWAAEPGPWRGDVDASRRTKARAGRVDSARAYSKRRYQSEKFRK